MRLEYKSMSALLAGCVHGKESERRWIIERYNLPLSLEFRGAILVDKWNTVVGAGCWMEHRGTYYVLRHGKVHIYN